MARRFYYVQSVIIRSSAAQSSSYIRATTRIYPVACSKYNSEATAGHASPAKRSRPLENETSEIVYPAAVRQTTPRPPGLSFGERAGVRLVNRPGMEYLWSVARGRNVSRASCVIIIHPRAPMTRNVNSSSYYARVPSFVRVPLFLFSFFFFYSFRR